MYICPLVKCVAQWKDIFYTVKICKNRGMFTLMQSLKTQEMYMKSQYPSTHTYRPKLADQVHTDAVEHIPTKPKHPHQDTHKCVHHSH